jgi:TonB dependent receptor/Carboxypeptidase regulatory-like domain
MERTKTSPLWKAGAALLALACLTLLLPAGAQAQAAGGTLFGRVIDGSGSPLPGATVTATNRATGVSRVVVTDETGAFRIPSLPAGEYDVRVDLSGFAEVVVENVRVNVATERQVEVTLQSSAVEETITVVDEAPLVATEPAIGTVVSQNELENLPLNGRQFANLAALAPGTTLSVNPDPTKPGQLTVALAGGIGRNVNYMIDGGDNTDDTIGGALQNFNLESVQEFKIQTQQYKAEYGRSSGGVLTVVTKTGTNEFDGTVYGFFRDDGLNEKTESERRAGIDKQPYSRDQYGASIGGPIARDRSHFFATYEKTERETSYTIDTGGIFPNFDGQSVALPFEDELATAKVTFDVNPRNFLQVRYGYQKNADKYGATPLALPDSLGTLTNEYDSILGGWTAQIGSDMLNEVLVQVSNFDNLIAADSNNPTIYFPSGVTQGQNINTPQSTHQEKTQFKDDFSWSMTLGGDRHDFKAGVNYIDEPTLGGDFSTGLNGQFVRLADSPTAPISDITIFGGFFGETTPTEQTSFYLQDDWMVNDRLTLNLGLRYDLFEGFDLDQRSNPIWQTLSTQTRYNEYFLQDFQGGRGGVLEEDDDNWGPRIGFTWDVKGDGRNLLRGGWGIYYDFPYTNATILFPTAAVQSNYGVVFNHNNPDGIRNPNGSFFQPGDPLPPNQLPGADIPPPNEVASPTLATPYSTQASLGYSWQATSWLGVTVEAITIDYEDIPFRFRANPIDPTTGRRRFPAFANFRLWYGGGEASYDGLNLQVKARSTERLEFQGFYTYSEAEGNVLAGADEFRVTDLGHQPDMIVGRDVSVNPLDPLCGACFGPLNTDARHRFTLAGAYRGPWDVVFSGMFRYRSALPYTVHAGRDLNGDGFAIDLPPGGSVNTERGASFSQFDVRIAKEFSFTDDFSIELIGEIFNLFDEDNPAGFVGAQSSAIFGKPTSFAGDPLQGEQRLAQLGLRLRF